VTADLLGHEGADADERDGVLLSTRSVTASQLPPQAYERPLTGAPTPAPVSGDPFAEFTREVAHRQLISWMGAWADLPPRMILDISPIWAGTAPILADAGHDVVQTLPDLAYAPLMPDRGPADGAIRHVTADPCDFTWLAPASVDGIVAEGQVLSDRLATEETLRELVRALRPGGRILLSVDSLVLGLARLAEQQRWAELADAPSADVVVVPRADGTLGRCFWPAQLRASLEEVGLDVEWVRPRTVLSRATVERTLTGKGNREELLAAEMLLACEREDDAVGSQLVAAAFKR
jgi:hypothetical protein